MGERWRSVGCDLHVALVEGDVGRAQMSELGDR